MRKFVITVCVMFSALLFPLSSNAHNQVISTFPEQYSNQTPIPVEAWIQFDSQIQLFEGLAENTLEVIDSTGLTVSYGELVIDRGRVWTKISGQSAPGVFTVNYRIVGEDGHVIEDSYTFNASPDYSKSAPEQVKIVSEGSKTNLGLIFALVFGLILLMVVIMKNNLKKKE